MGLRARTRTNKSRKAKTGFIHVILTLMTILACLPMAAFAESPDQVSTTKITVSSPGLLKPGQEFTIQVRIEGNPGFAAAAFQLAYDQEALELKGFGTDGLMRDGMVGDVGVSSVGYLAVANLNGDGVLFTADFKIREDAVDGTYLIRLDLRDGDEDNFVDAAANAIPVQFAAGIALVSSYGPSQSTGNGPATPGQDQPGGDGQGSSADQISDIARVTAVDADGSALEFMMRKNGELREYSLNEGTAWSTVPDDGIITTPGGKSISVDGSGDTDYFVRDLPDALAVQAGSLNSSATLPPQAWVGIIAGLALVVVALVIIVGRAKGADGKANRTKV